MKKTSDFKITAGSKIPVNNIVSQKWKPVRPEGAERRFGKFKLSIHRHIDYPKEIWFASCELFTRKQLTCTDLDKAKIEAKNMLRKLLHEALKEIDG